MTRNDLETASGSQWGNLVLNEYDDMGRHTKQINFYEPETKIDIPNVGTGKLYYQGDEIVFKDVVVNLAGQMKSVQFMAYDDDGRLVSQSTHGFGDLDVIDKARELAQTGGLSGARKQSELDPELYIYEISGLQSLSMPTLNTDSAAQASNKQQALTYVYDSAGRTSTYTMENASASPTYKHFYATEYVGSLNGYQESVVTGTSPDDDNFKTTKTYSYYDQNGQRFLVEEITPKQTNVVDPQKGNKVPLDNTTVHARYFSYDQQGNLLHRVSGTQDESAINSDGSLDNAVRLTFEKQSPGGPLKDKTEGIEVGFMYAAGQYLGELDYDGSSRVKGQHFSAMDSQTDSSTQKHIVMEKQTLRELASYYYGNGDYWYIIGNANALSAGSSDELTEGTALTIPEMAVSNNTFSNFKPQNIGEMIGSTTPSLPYLPPPPSEGCNALATLIVNVVTVVVTAYLGPVAGDMAGQLTGIALGTRDSFSFGELAGAAVMQSLSTTWVEGSNATFTQQVQTLNSAGKMATSTVLNSVGKAAVAGAGAITTAGVNKITGQPSGFSWRNLAGSMGTAYLGNEWGISTTATGRTATGAFISDFVGDIAQQGLSYGIRRGLGDKNAHWRFKDVAVDAFGNALGNEIVDRMQASSTTELVTKKVGEIKSSGMSQQDQQRAIQTVFEEQGVVFDAGEKSNRDGGSDSSADDAVKDQSKVDDADGNFDENGHLIKRMYISGRFDKEGNLTLQKMRDGKVVEGEEGGRMTANYSMLSSEETSTLREVHESIVDFSGDLLSTNSALMYTNALLFQRRMEAQNAEMERYKQVNRFRRERNDYAARREHARFEHELNQGVSTFEADPNKWSAQQQLAITHGGMLTDKFSKAVETGAEYVLKGMEYGSYLYGGGLMLRAGVSLLKGGAIQFLKGAARATFISEGGGCRGRNDV